MRDAPHVTPPQDRAGARRAAGRAPRASLVPLEGALAWRYLRGRRRSGLLSLVSLLAIGGVAVGVAALVLVMGVMTGMRHTLRDRILLGSAEVLVMRVGDALRLDDWPALLARVRGAPGVAAAAPAVYTEGLLWTRGTSRLRVVQVVGVEPDRPGDAADRSVTAIRRHATGRRPFAFRGADGVRPGVVLGRRLADTLGVALGDRVVLLTNGSADAGTAAGDAAPAAAELEVTGIVATGMYEYDMRYAWVALADAQRLAALGDAVSVLEVRTRDVRRAGAVAEALGPPYFARDWATQNGVLFQALRLQRVGMAAILLIVVVVAAFNVVGTLTMVVADKTREIGILKAMGLPPRSIRRVFLLQGLVIGLAGTLAGILLGMAVALVLGRWAPIALDPAVYVVDRLPVTIEAWDVALAAAASLVIAAVATAYPAARAARLDPIAAIRQD